MLVDPSKCLFARFVDHVPGQNLHDALGQRGRFLDPTTSREDEPFERLDHVLVGAFAHEQRVGKVVLGQRVTLFGGADI